MNFFKRIFRKKREQKPKQLRIDGCKTTMTPQPDDAELAAHALLESGLSAPPSKKNTNKGNHSLQSQGGKRGGGVRDAAFYRELSDKIRASWAAEARLTMRYLAYCEEQLALPMKAATEREEDDAHIDSPEREQARRDKRQLYVGHLVEMEQELYKRQTVAEREGGKLLRRWQHCLAEVILRQMSAAHTDTDEMTEDDTTTDDTD